MIKNIIIVLLLGVTGLAFHAAHTANQHQLATLAQMRDLEAELAGSQQNVADVCK